MSAIQQIIFDLISRTEYKTTGQLLKEVPSELSMSSSQISNHLHSLYKIGVLRKRSKYNRKMEWRRINA